MALFIVNKEKNEAISIEKKTFHDLGFKERKHLQEWICKNTEMLGEDLLIIQKEFSGFDDTSERLDLLAIDRDGNLVIIENKLDDSGKDVTWQALKYVSYCSSLSKGDIKGIYQNYLDINNIKESAEKLISDFFKLEDFNEVELNTGDQRIILVSASFRKEVTSTVMWLLDHNVKIKCIRVTPYILGEQVLIDTEQIIPIKDAEEYQIKLANKKQEEYISKEKNQTRHIIRMRFWTDLLKVMNEKSELFKNVSPSKDNWLGCGSGHSGLAYIFNATGNFARIELWINRGNQEENKRIFDKLKEKRESIEGAFGDELEWQRLDAGKGSRIAYYLNEVSIFEENDWFRMIEFLTDNMVKFEKVIKEFIYEAIKSN